MKLVSPGFGGKGGLQRRALSILHRVGLGLETYLVDHVWIGKDRNVSARRGAHHRQIVDQVKIRRSGQTVGRDRRRNRRVRSRLEGATSEDGRAITDSVAGID